MFHRVPEETQFWNYGEADYRQFEYNAGEQEFTFNAYNRFSSETLNQPPVVDTAYAIQANENEKPFNENSVVDFNIDEE